jgi:protein TonB
MLNRTLLFVPLALALGVSRASAAELHVPELEAKHAAIFKPAPELSQVARQLKVSGRVELAVTIDASGLVTDAKPVSGSPVLSSTCVTAVKTWKFKPFTQDGKASGAVTTLSFEFKQ